MIYEYDGSNDCCPLPLVKMRQLLKKMTPEDSCIIKIKDQGSKSDIPKFLDNKGYQYSQHQINDSIFELRIKSR